MGDFYDEQTRISDNFKRVADFKTGKTSSKAYITLSCKDPKNWCTKQKDRKSIGGYAWTVEGWLAYYHYIALCPPLFTLDNLAEKLNFVEQGLASGYTEYARQMKWLGTSGSCFLHELMHTRIATAGIEPKIKDQHLVVGRKHSNDLWATGPKLVHRLASWRTTDGGGVKRASLNADSYAMLANCIWSVLPILSLPRLMLTYFRWWNTTGYFPGLEPPRRRSLQPQHDVSQHNSSNLPISLWIDLENTTTPQDADFDSLFNAQLRGF